MLRPLAWGAYETAGISGCSRRAIAALPLAARAQQPGPVARIVLWLGATPSDPEVQRYVAAFRETIRGFGWDDGRNLRVDVRWYAPSFTVEELQTIAVELAALGPDVIVTTGAPILRALHRETKAIPIVFTQVTDPVGDGFVANLARPGGNITGFTIFEHSFAGKWLEMLKEVVPSITRVAVCRIPVIRPGTPTSASSALSQRVWASR